MEQKKKWNYTKLTLDEKTQYNIQELTSDYVRIELASTDEVNKKRIEENNYIWVDRTVRARINLQYIEPDFSKLIRMNVRELDYITKDVYEIARKAFKRDRRFYLSYEYRAEVGFCVLKDYIFQYSGKESLILGCFYGDKLVGTLIAVKVGDYAYETVLGAVLPEWQARGAGISLYAFEFSALKEKGANILYSRISTDNISSLNLHLTLSKGNISFMQPLDVYVKK